MSVEAEWSQVLRAGSGFAILPAAVDTARCTRLLDRAWNLARLDPRVRPGTVVVRYENGIPDSVAPEQRISKLYRLHRAESAFRDVFDSWAVAEALVDVIGPDVDLFLSQVVFKPPGTLGQPWHQDSTIFPFEPAHPVVGAWCALTDAIAPSSRLAVQAGSQLAGEQAHGPDASQGRFVALIDQPSVGGAELELHAGDLVVFDSLLVHATTDNASNEARVAATAHFAVAGTVDRTAKVFGANPYNDWMPWLRGCRRVNEAS